MADDSDSTQVLMKLHWPALSLYKNTSVPPSSSAVGVPGRSLSGYIECVIYTSANPSSKPSAKWAVVRLRCGTIVKGLLPFIDPALWYCLWCEQEVDMRRHSGVESRTFSIVHVVSIERRAFDISLVDALEHFGDKEKERLSHSANRPIGQRELHDTCTGRTTDRTINGLGSSSFRGSLRGGCTRGDVIARAQTKALQENSNCATYLQEKLREKASLTKLRLINVHVARERISPLDLTPRTRRLDDTLKRLGSLQRLFEDTRYTILDDVMDIIKPLESTRNHPAILQVLRLEVADLRALVDLIRVSPRGVYELLHTNHPFMSSMSYEFQLEDLDCMNLRMNARVGSLDRSWTADPYTRPTSSIALSRMVLAHESGDDVLEYQQDQMQREAVRIFRKLSSLQTSLGHTWFRIGDHNSSSDVSLTDGRLLMSQGWVLQDALKPERIHLRELIERRNLTRAVHDTMMTSSDTLEDDNAHSVGDTEAELEASDGVSRSSIDSLCFTAAENELILDEYQQQVLSLMSHGGNEQLGIFVIHGGPGSGKTTLIRSLLATLRATPSTVLLLAPTGSAARTLAEKCGASAYTISMALQKAHSQWKVVKIIVVDESSMLNECDLHRIFRKIHESSSVCSRVILVGDPLQLSPMGLGAPMMDLLKYHEPRTFALQASHRSCAPIGLLLRQMISSGCASTDQWNWHLLNHESEFPTLAGAYFMDTSRFTSSVQAIDTWRSCVTFPPTCQLQFITRHNYTRDALHALWGMQKSPTTTTGEASAGNFKAGQMICFRANTYKSDSRNAKAGLLDSATQNGQVCRIVQIVDYLPPYDPETAWVVPTTRAPATSRNTRRAIEVENGDFSRNWVDLGRCAAHMVEFALCITINCSQGKEYPCVVYVVDESASTMKHYTKSHLYTAASRAQGILVVCAKKATMELIASLPAQSLHERRTDFSLSHPALNGQIGKP